MTIDGIEDNEQGIEKNEERPRLTIKDFGSEYLTYGDQSWKI